MSDKCEWKEGKFNPCDFMGSELDENSHYELLNKANIFIGDIEVDFCPFCGADIRKPEPEVIIRKNGGTWVLKKDGIDYLMTYQECCDFNKEEISHMVETNWPKGWKQINDKDGNQVLEITDEIAKLRPIVIHSYAGNSARTILYAVKGNLGLVSDGFFGLGNFRLATVSDLEDDHA